MSVCVWSAGRGCALDDHERPRARVPGPGRPLPRVLCVRTRHARASERTSPRAAMQAVNTELELFSPWLARKPQVVVLNK
eukprot:3973954-Prymnesium_polylepis.1